MGMFGTRFTSANEANEHIAQLEAENAALREQIEQLAAALAEKDAALRDTLDAIGALARPHELIGYGLSQDDIDAIFSAIALQPHASLVAKIKAEAVRDAAEWCARFDKYPYGELLDYADRIERGEVK